MTNNVANLHLYWRNLIEVGKSINLGVLIELVKSHTTCFPHTLSSIPLRFTNQVLSVILTNPEVLHADNDFLTHAVGVVDAVGINRDTNTSGLVLDVEVLVDVALLIATGHPSVDVGVFLAGVDEVSAILPVFSLELGYCHVSLMLGMGHHHGGHVEVFVTSHSHKHEQQCIKE